MPSRVRPSPAAPPSSLPRHQSPLSVHHGSAIPGRPPRHLAGCLTPLTAVLVALVTLSPWASPPLAVHAAPGAPATISGAHEGQRGTGATVHPLRRSASALMRLSHGVTARSVSAGTYYSLALGTDGHVYAWGDSGSGQLGNGSTINRSTPVQVLLPRGVTALSVSAGNAHSLALGSDGQVYAWGDNTSDELGNGGATSSDAPVRVRLSGGVTARSVSAGATHSLALGSDGQVYAWGTNSSGQLGNGGTTNSPLPLRVRLPRGVTARSVSAGFDHSLALGSDGHVYAWGNNNSGQLGIGSTTDRHTPVQVLLPRGVTALSVSAGSLFSLALGSDGRLYAWGSNESGQLGAGSTTDRHTPVQVLLSHGVTPLSISAGGTHSLAGGSDGHSYAWGDNTYGELGDGGTTNTPTPAQILLPGGVTARSIAKW